MIARWLLAAALGIGMAQAAGAAPLTCAAFKDRLGGALMTGGDTGSEMLTYQDTRSTSDRGTHTNWTTSTLSGSLACGAEDRFGEFYVSLNVAGRDEFVSQLKQLVALDGAALCTMAAGNPAACIETGKTVLQDALQQVGAGFKRRANNPHGLSSQTLWPDVRIEVTGAPSLITFSLATTDGGVVDAERRPLPPPGPAKPGP